MGMAFFSQEDIMEMRPVDISNLQDLIFERRQIVALLDNQELWLQIPLVHRFAIVESSEFMILMGEAFTVESRYMLESEVEAMSAIIH
jgi:hypothetical protein